MDYSTYGLPLMRLYIGENLLDDATLCGVRSVEACWLQGEEVVGYILGSFYGASEPGISFLGTDMLEACCELDEPTFEVCRMLCESNYVNDPFFEIGHTMHWLVEVSEMEVHPKFRGKGLGTQMVQQFFDVLKANHAIGFFFFKLSPPQYTEGGAENGLLDPDVNSELFVREKNKLVA